MRFLNWLLGRKQLDIDPAPIHEGYAKLLDSEWDRYLQWRDAQVCVNCGKAHSEKGMSMAEWGASGATELDDSMWVTETQCVPCWKKHGAGGKSRADMLSETGNIYL